MAMAAADDAVGGVGPHGNEADFAAYALYVVRNYGCGLCGVTFECPRQRGAQVVVGKNAVVALEARGSTGSGDTVVIRSR